jgi:two-component sensor histidine kinase
MLNELITNAIRHAFPDQRAGSVRLTLRRCGPGRVELAVEDDGVGIPKDFDPGKSGSLGMLLVRTLVEQVGGELEIRRENGTRFQVRLFAEDARG